MLNPDKFYRPTDADLRPFAAVQTFARWRHEGKGPKFVKAGGKVLYRGSDVLTWLESRTVETAA